MKIQKRMKISHLSMVSLLCLCFALVVTDISYGGIRGSPEGEPFANTLNLSDYSITYLNNGISYYNKGEYDNAIKEFSRLIVMLPGFAPAYYLRGIAYNDNGDHTSAINDFQKACEMRFEDGCKALYIIS